MSQGCDFLLVDDRCVLNHLVQLFFSVFLGLYHWDCSQLNICFDWWWFEVPLSFSRILACLWFLVFSDSWFISVSPHYASTDHRAWCEAVPFSRFRIMILPTFRFYWVLGFLGLRSWLWATSRSFHHFLRFFGVVLPRIITISMSITLQCGGVLDWYIFATICCRVFMYLFKTDLTHVCCLRVMFVVCCDFLSCRSIIDRAAHYISD